MICAHIFIPTIQGHRKNANQITMNHGAMTQLDKILALADSNHDGEAVGAVRMARQILSKEGLKFGDLARIAYLSLRLAEPFSLFSGHRKNMESQLVILLQKFNDLKNDSQYKETQLDFWRLRAAEVEQQLAISQSDASRWKQIAKEATEKLWDISKMAISEEFQTDKAAEEDYEDSPPVKIAVNR